MKKTIAISASVILVVFALGSQTVANEIGRTASPKSVANAPGKTSTYHRPVIIEYFTGDW